MEDREVLSAFFTLIFTDKELQNPETWGKVWSKAELHLLEEDLVKEYLNNLDNNTNPWNLMGYSQEVLRELSHVPASSPFIICERLCWWIWL